MKSGISASQLWTQQPVGSRLVEVNTKTGFSLTAGSYTVIGTIQRGSFSQAGISVTTTISAVTVSNTNVSNMGFTNPSSTTLDATLCRIALTNTTTITGTLGIYNAGTPVVGWEAVPFV